MCGTMCMRALCVFSTIFIALIQVSKAQNEEPSNQQILQAIRSLENNINAKLSGIDTTLSAVKLDISMMKAEMKSTTRRTSATFQEARKTLTQLNSLKLNITEQLSELNLNIESLVSFNETNINEKCNETEAKHDDLLKFQETLNTSLVDIKDNIAQLEETQNSTQLDINDNIAQLEETQNSTQLDINDNIARCPESENTFRAPGSNQCMTLLLDEKRSREAANAKCNDMGLVLAIPHNAVALRKYLVEKYDLNGRDTTWVNGRGDGSRFVWQQQHGGHGGKALDSSSPLWWPGDPGRHVTTGYCLVLLTDTYSLTQHPEHPYATSTCTWTTRWTLCERIVE